MKKIVKIFNNFIKRTIFKVENKTNDKFHVSNFSKYIIAVIVVLFIYIFYLSIPLLYDKNWIQNKIVTELGMLYIHIPVDWEAPTVEDLKVFFGVMEALDGQKVLVHCAMNYRVSAFMYKYLTLIKGHEHDASTSPILRSWQPSMSDSWKSILALKTDDF